ncbi:MAG: hypothetical protein GWN62_27880 [Aliifodinibius sp.]|nr:hypothetical protein [Fodinibius sp.]
MVNDLQEIEAYLKNIRIPLRLACKTQSGWPMIVSLWFNYQNGQLFCATQKSSRVVAYLIHDPQCAFEISADLPPYCGVRGQAVASLDENIGATILEKLLVRYLGGTDNELANTLLAKSETEVAIVLDPKRIYTWDFSERMSSIHFTPPLEKFCP